MTVFVLTPVLEEIEDREDFAVGILFEVAVNSDVTPIADLFRQVSGVKDEFRLKEGVVLVGRQEAEIQLHPEITHRLVEETGMASFVTSHVSEALR